ncbi:hypothetical protein GQ55_2G298500 [Panicum hallii var. hallii]|uniref:Uncharacterized protein n=1 Tax=Panicum hallii var. hallii TaxID=1504633 RepID=A0A2T7ETT3_9POAL|nr:hypothetical protein GQ55_2G298500 [Panicum hallii var. hallii]
MVLCKKKETELNFVQKDDHRVVHRAQGQAGAIRRPHPRPPLASRPRPPRTTTSSASAARHMPHGGGGRRAGRAPVLRFRGAARPRARGAGHPCVPSRGAREYPGGWGGGPRRLTCGSREGCSSRGPNPARDTGPALAPMPRPRPRRLLFRSEHSPPRADLDARLRLSVSGDPYFRSG